MALVALPPSFGGAAFLHLLSICSVLFFYLPWRRGRRGPACKQAEPFFFFTWVLKIFLASIATRFLVTVMAYVRQCDPSLSFDWHDDPPQEVRALMQDLLDNAPWLIVLLSYIMVALLQLHPRRRIEIASLQHRERKQSERWCAGLFRVACVITCYQRAPNVKIPASLLGHSRRVHDSPLSPKKFTVIGSPFRIVDCIC